ncbi:hypothetical protein GCM10007874_44280 [Labrys miyagiensis]|uniref:DUF2867 domain-containing protein n=1 Tax=Labrys miyagiensis TaxID=346912 RepID=A0ABQ6CT84_9HYPH|nr:DUF2867 domain-containing protein [Labrys miyagiensis]GLS21411.1 hypothetical protein GCM10007874_44280 [Labrys miyagiensis]
MRTHAVKPEAEIRRLLPGAQFADAFRLEVADPSLDARRAAERVIGCSPQWIDMLLTLRNMVVAPFGLHTQGPPDQANHGMLGIFPVISQTPDRVVAGFDDKHLDFRIVVDVSTPAARRNVTLSTVVLTHNLLGRAYLATILPFHKLIAQTMLRQLAKA